MNNKNILLYNIDSIAKKMTTDFHNVTNHINHMGLRGTSREDILRNYIKDLLPKKFTVGSGIIIDANGTQSKQQDFYIYDAFQSPVILQYESYAIIPIESVYASVEIKSTLNSDTLKQSVENIKSVKSLELQIQKNELSISTRHNIVFGVIFAYSSSISIETIAGNLMEYCKNLSYNQQPNIICILDQGVVLRVSKLGGGNVELDPGENNTYAIIKEREEINLYIFYLLLLQHLNTTCNFPPDLLQYAERAGALKSIKTEIPLDLIPDDFSLPFGNSSFNAEELRLIGKNYSIAYKYLMNQMTTEDLKAHGVSKEEVEQIISELLSMIVSKTSL